jgi:isoleucyl-tRNA synthetase
LEFSIPRNTSVNFRPELFPGRDTQTGAVHRDGDTLTGSIGRGYKVTMVKVAKV